MKTLLPLLLALFLGGLPAAAQEPVSVSFADPARKESQFVQALADMHGVTALETSLAGRIAGRWCQLDVVRVIDGAAHRTPWRSFIADADTLRLLFAARPVAKDSVLIVLRSPAHNTFPVNGYHHATVAESSRCILMETFPEKTPTTADAIAVAAFCSGMPISKELPNGLKITGVNYCKVRDGHIHPSKWHEQFELRDYLYFELRFTDPPEFLRPSPQTPSTPQP